MIVALVAGMCMMVQDSLAVVKYQAASRNRGFIVAGVDVVIWLVSITSTTIAAFTLHSGSTSAKVSVVVAVTLANIFGNLLGTEIGKRFVTDEDEQNQNKKIAQLEERIKKLEG